MLTNKGKARLLLIILCILAMILFRIVLDNVFYAALLSLITMAILYIAWANIRMNKRLNILNKDCDPELFIAMTKKQREITGAQAASYSILTLSLVNALIKLGKFEEGLDTLDNIDYSHLSTINGSLFKYTTLYLTCLYELGRTEEAEILYETKIPLAAPVNEKMRSNMEVIIADRLYHLGRYDEAKEIFERKLEDKIPKVIRMNILYRLAQIDEILCDYDFAREKFNEIILSAPKLWIADQAILRLEEYKILN